MTYLILISSCLAFFLAILVVFKKRRSYSDWLLFSWLIFIALHTGLEYFQLYNAEHGYPFPWVIGITFSFTAVHPILIFVYILSTIQPSSRNRRIFWHLLPVVLVNLALVLTFYLKTPSEKIRIFENALMGIGYDDMGVELTTYLVLSLTFGYLIANIYLLRRHSRVIRNQFSTLEGKDLKWLRKLLYSAAFVLLISILFEVTNNYLNISSPGTSNTIIYFSLAAGLFYLGLSGIRQTDIFVESDPSLEVLSDSVKQTRQTPSNKMLEDPAVSDQENRRKYEKLLDFMQTEKPFLDSNLNLAMLSGQLGYKTHLLSHLINDYGGRNFFDFVNSYRIEEFKRMVGQPEQRKYTLISIAYDCGFNSKATFNRVFRSFTGLSPSDYFNSLPDS